MQLMSIENAGLIKNTVAETSLLQYLIIKNNNLFAIFSTTKGVYRDFFQTV
jgi:hypothetical protein